MCKRGIYLEIMRLKQNAILNDSRHYYSFEQSQFVVSLVASSKSKNSVKWRSPLRKMAYGITEFKQTDCRLLILNFLERSAGCFFITNKYFNVVPRGFFLFVKNDDKNKDRLDKFAMETVSRMFVINEWSNDNEKADNFYNKVAINCPQCVWHGCATSRLDKMYYITVYHIPIDKFYFKRSRKNLKIQNPSWLLT